MEYLSPFSYWLHGQKVPAPRFAPLDADRQVDVAVVGAGITGLTAALHLKQAGKEVVVLEAGRVGAGTSSGTSGHLDVLPDHGLVKLETQFGQDAARDVTRARMQAIDQIEEWIGRLGMECDFRRVPARAYTEQAGNVEGLCQQHEAAQRLALNVRMLPDAALPFPTAGSLEIANQARFHVMNYLRGLASAIQGENASIHEQTRAEPPDNGRPCVVRANGRRVTAENVILATHSSYLGISQFDVRQAPYQSYVMAVRVEEEVPDALYWDDKQPYHYLRLAASGDPRLLIVGGADHKTGQADEQQHARELREYVARRFTTVCIEGQWSSELFEPADGLPYIGRVPLSGHLFVATGFSGTGLTYGTAAGKVLADLILGRPSPLADVFSPARFKPLAAAKDFISENLNVAKHFVADRFAAQRAESPDAVKAGEGRVLQLDGNTYAIYRDEQNQLHCLSPVCTHAGCHVHWNSGEKTWDCPCHGGRFAPTGERIYGPPPADLQRTAPSDATWGKSVHGRKDTHIAPE